MYFAGGNNNNINTPRASPVTGTLGMVQSYSRMAIYLCIVLYLVPFTGIQLMCYKAFAVAAFITLAIGMVRIYIMNCVFVL